MGYSLHPFKSLSGKDRFWLLVSYLVLALVLLDLFYLAIIWPNWQDFQHGPIPKSHLIKLYEKERLLDPALPALRWFPVPLKVIPLYMRRAVIIAEDQRFFEHEGIDWEAIQTALKYNLEQGKIVFGASTISQQTVKNLFLTGERTPLRKIHEFLLTWDLERNLAKARILTIYLNIAEFGRGVFGVEAAARHYYGVGTAELSLEEAAELAATLPSPKLHNPFTRTRQFLRRRERNLRILQHWFPEVDENIVEEGG